MSIRTEPTPMEIEKDQIYISMGMTPEEFEKVKGILGRLPNYTELGLFSVMWSEHCSYKNSKVLLRKFPIEGSRVLQGPGEGAGIVDIGDNQAVVFKMESHNHPSAVEPFDGAATGVGGVVRDIFSMGARPVAALNALRFGELKSDRMKFLLKKAVAGIADYGIGVGIPTVGGEIYFDDCYEGNPLVNAMCVGIINHEHIQKGQAHGEGNIVIYAGAGTGRDGIHGATFASEELSETEERKSSSVPKGNPHVEKLLIEACLEVMKHPALVGIQDMGAAGLISSSSEMASKAGMGIELNLDFIPQLESHMTAYEMMLSESQERMLMVAKKGHEQEIINIFKNHGVDAAAVGQVTGDKLVRILHKGEVAAEVPADALAKQAPEYHRPSHEAKRDLTPATVKPISDYNQTLLDLLSQPTIASKEWVYGQFNFQDESQNQTKGHVNVAVAPGSDGAVMGIEGTNKAIVMTTDCNSRYVYLDPHTGGKIAVAESARNIVASGGTPLAITDCLNYGSPENPEVFWQMEQSIDGISEACRVLDTPVISGNVSLYNESNGTAIFPTPAIGMVGLVEDIAHVTTQDFKAAGDLIYVIGETKAEFGGSELQKLQYGKFYGMPPAIDMSVEKANQDMLLNAIKAGLVQSAHDISEGGLAVALAESLMSGENELGAEIKLTMDADNLFSESQSRFVVTVKAEDKAAFEKQVQAQHIGHVTGTGRLVIGDVIDLAVEACRKQWKGAIPCLLK